MDKKIQILFEKCKNFKYVSFDIFDTLLFRKVSDYKDIFDLVELSYNYDFNSNIYDYREKRINAEIKARNISCNQDIKLSDIYDIIEYPNEVKNKLLKIEKNVELDNCYPNLPMIEFLNLCKNRGKTIVITSDMYLPESHLSIMLKKCGVSFDYIFISGELGYTKQKGDLFQIVLKELKINNFDICHIGDNLLSDIKMSKKNGIQSFLRILPKNIKCYNSKYFSKHCGFLSGICRSENNFLLNESVNRISNNVIAPFLMSFCNWIYSITQNNSLIGFVAREGFLIKKCYEIIFPNSKTIYFNYNKNTLRLPMLYLEPTVECFFKTISYRKSYKLKEIFDLLYIDSKYFTTYLKELGIDTINHTFLREEMNNNSFKNLFSNILKLISPSLRNQYNLLTKDLTSLSKNTDKIYLVNNSINGNLQILLNDFCKRTCIKLDFKGLQFISTLKCKKILKHNVFEFFDNSKSDLKDKRIFSSYSLILEHFLFKNCGTAKYLKEEENSISVVLDEIGCESHNESIIGPLQNEIVIFFKNYKKYYNFFDAKASIKILTFFLTRPITGDINYVIDIKDRDFYGDSSIIEKKYKICKNLFDFIKNIKDIDKVKWAHAYLILNKRYKLFGFLFDLYKSLKFKGF